MADSLKNILNMQLCTSPNRAINFKLEGNFFWIFFDGGFCNYAFCGEGEVAMNMHPLKILRNPFV